MGKKKNKQEKVEPAVIPKIEREAKGKKSYSLDVDKKGASRDSDDTSILKVKLAPDKEAAILDLIQQYKQEQIMTGTASKRITSKKLMDVYSSLSRAGFKHSQIEQAMSSTIQHGGDLIDALDWLCLYLPNDQLPGGFSQALTEEENKLRPRFADTDVGQSTAEQLAASFYNPFEAAIVKPVMISEKQDSPEDGACGGGRSMKDWIMQYAEEDSEDEDDRDEMKEDQKEDPNSLYMEMMAKFLDAREEASVAKVSGDKDAQRKAGKIVQNCLQEMDRLEHRPGFNPQIKLDSVEKMKQPVKPAVVKKPQPEPAKAQDEGELGFALFEEQAAAQPPKLAKKEKTKLDKRSFEYTRAQWTGKSPKQFLIDWIRKNLKGSPPPSYQQVKAGGNLWRSRCKVVRKKEGDVVVCPEIVTENLKEAEHLASTLALYQLCRGQKVYQLLPPVYRDVWLEWQETEDKVKESKKEQENKPRDQFLAKLMKKLKVESNGNGASSEVKVQQEVEESWEDLASDEEAWDASDEEEEQKKATEKEKAPKRVKPFDQKTAHRIFTQRQQSAPYKNLLAVRQQLPVYPFREEILQTIGRENVLVIAGETGSGKSTQIPQYILEEFLSSTSSSACNIVCTQPRRISAMSLANRVSEELGEAGPGTHKSFCGYQIRFESKKSDTTRLLYCTTGVLLRKLQSDPLMSDVTHIIVDEVHERSVQSDFLLILLRRILKQRPDLKVVLMSATVDSDKFSAYFQHCRVFNIPGRTFPVEVLHLEDVIEKTQYVVEEESPYLLRASQLVKEEHTQLSVTGKGGDAHSMDVSWTKHDISTIDNTDLDPSSYSKRTRNIVTRLNPDRVNLDLIMELLRYLETDEYFSAIDGAVLIFLPGLSHIQDLYEMMETDRNFSDPNSYRIVALHSVLSSQDQNAAFTVPPPGVRKVVIATNIAETGITIPDVVFVIDSGKAKENRYSETTQMSTLAEVYVSQASARQRQGRAGRVRDGFCFRLFSKQKFESLRPYSVPEILRVPLEELCLHIMKCELGSPTDFLSQALDPPNSQNINRAMAILREVGACHNNPPNLTPLGHHLAALPVNVRVGKMLLFGAVFGCLEAVAVIGASMTDKSPFAVPIGQRDKADVARQSMATACSDPITMYKAFLGWKSAQCRGRGAESQYCQKCYLKRTTLLDIENVAKDLVKLVQSIGFHDSVTGNQFDSLSGKQCSVLKAVLTAGLYPYVGKITHSPKVDSAANPMQAVCVAQTSQGPAAIHPASINRFLTANGYVLYSEKVRHNQIYLRDVSLISPYPLLLFGGNITVQHQSQQIAIDEWIKFKAFARTGVIFKELRFLIDNLLERKLSTPSLQIADDPVVKTLIELITSER